jgi:Bacterial tandem repeat domain 1
MTVNINDVNVYHGRNSAQHEAEIGNLRANFRMISLSIYGDVNSPLYAAVWVKRTGPEWREVHGEKVTNFQATVNRYKSEGFAPVLVSATGPINNAVYAAVFERGIEEPSEVGHDMPLNVFNTSNSHSAKKSYISSRSQSTVIPAIVDTSQFGIQTLVM